MCGAHATVRGLLGEIVARAESDRHIVVDMEAGLEHLSRGTGRHMSRVLAVVEPYYRSMETARRIAELAHELGVVRVQAVSNKIRNDADRQAVTAFCAAHGLDIAGEIPYDASLAEAERTGRAPIEASPDAPAVASIRQLAQTILDS